MIIRVSLLTFGGFKELSKELSWHLNILSISEAAADLEHQPRCVSLEVGLVFPIVGLVQDCHRQESGAKSECSPWDWL